MRDQIYIIGGGTFSYLRGHCAMAAVAFGTTAIDLINIITYDSDFEGEVHLYTTRMADDLFFASKLTRVGKPFGDGPTVEAVSFEDGVSSIDGDLYNYLTTLFEELVKAPSPTIMHLQIVRETVTNEPKAEDATARLVAAIKRRAVAERKVKRLEAELLSARQDLEAVTLERNAAQQEIEEAAIAEAGE